MIKDIINAQWEELKKTFSSDIKKINVKKLLDEAENSSKSILQSHLEKGVTILEEGIHCLLQLQNVWDQRANQNKHLKNHAFWFLISREIELVCAIYRLINVGIEPSSKILMRSLHENTDIAIAMLYNHELSKKYMPDKSYDENKFWKNNFSKGALSTQGLKHRLGQHRLKGQVSHCTK
ncbi:MAG: hypothetical protein V4525_03760 [Pseudomonadota bacterium]